jgi:Cu-Zn family superoxide dismutase
MYAIASIEKTTPHNKLGISGNIYFFQSREGANTDIKINLRGFKPNSTHAIHIHETSDFSKGCMSAGPHYNPYKVNHGSVFFSGKNRHVGDLINNITSDKDGNVNISFSDDLVSLYQPYSVIDRSIVIHENPDDYGLGDNEESLITGNAGGRMACVKINKV